MATEGDVKIIGCILKAICTKETIDVLTIPENDDDSIAGWMFYATLSDKEGNIRLKGFQQLFCACAAMTFEIDNIAERTLAYFKTLGSKLKQYFNLDDDTKWEADSEKKVREEVRRKAEEWYPLVAKALFRYFGMEQNYGMLK